MSSYRDYMLRRFIEDNLHEEIDTLSRLVENRQQLEGFFGNLFGRGKGQNPQSSAPNARPQPRVRPGNDTKALPQTRVAPSPAKAPGRASGPSRAEIERLGGTGDPRFYSQKQNASMARFEEMKRDIYNDFQRLFTYLINKHSGDSWGYGVVNQILEKIKPELVQTLKKLTTMKGNVHAKFNYRNAYAQHQEKQRRDQLQRTWG